MVDVRTNLLKGRQTLSEKDYQKEQTYLRSSVYFMITVVVGVVVLSVWSFVLTRQLSGVDKQITGVRKEMQGLTEASVKQVYLKARLKLITGFLQDRSNTREALQKILSTSIANTHIAGLDFQDEVTLVVQYVADDAESLSKLLDFYQKDTNYYTQAVSRGLSRSRTGTYQSTLVLTLPKGGT